MKLPRSIQLGHQSGEGSKGGDTSPTSLQRTPMINQMSFGTWPRPLSHLAIYEIKEAWAGPNELQLANYAPRTLPKGLRFLSMVPTLESPKVMGLTGIHDLDALHHFNGITHCPWCGKEGQNGGTIVNHLWMVHYRLALVCDKCFSYPSTSMDTLHCHGWQNSNPQEREALASHPHWLNHQQKAYRVNLS